MMNQHQQPTLNQPHPGVQELISKANSTCVELADLLNAENSALEARQVDTIEDNLKVKRKLAHRFERLMSDIRLQRDALKQSPAAKRAAQQLQQNISQYEKLARRNMLLLQSAYDARASFLNTVRDAVAAQRPQPGLYTNTGEKKTHSNPASIVNQSV